jgi:3-methyladenine DNA glycosylase AlkC
MADALKDFYTPELVQRIGDSFSALLPGFNTRRFVKQATTDFATLSLVARARAIMVALRSQLPTEPAAVTALLMRSLGPKSEGTGSSGMAPFYYLPHALFVAEHLAEHFELAMRAQYEITQRFTAEFSIRTFIQRYPEDCFARLEQWTRDESPHVRRLVSEGTRSRLPWAMRVDFLNKNPQRVLALLELLKDDDSEYVRRSVANNLNDIGKDHPELLVSTCKRWSNGASAARKKLITHALRHAVKRGHSGAIALLGGGQGKQLIVSGKLTPKTLHVGEKIRVNVQVENPTRRRLSAIVDLRVVFPRPSGKASAKVFKLAKVTLGAGERAELSKLISLAVHTTRKPHPGKHEVHVLVDGEARELANFQLRA